MDTVLGELKAATPREAAEWFAAHPPVAELLDRTTGGGQARAYISEHVDALKSLTRGYGEGRERPEDYLEGFGRFVKENVNKLPALLVVTQRPRELTRETLKSLKLALDAAGCTEPQLQSAWRDVKNEDIAATIIGFVRRQALGEPLVPYAERVERALKKVLASRPWTPPQQQWLRRIGQQLTANVVLDRQSFDAGGLQGQGRLGRTGQDAGRKTGAGARRPGGPRLEPGGLSFFTGPAQSSFRQACDNSVSRSLCA